MVKVKAEVRLGWSVRRKQPTWTKLREQMVSYQRREGQRGEQRPGGRGHHPGDQRRPEIPPDLPSFPSASGAYNPNTRVPSQEGAGSRGWRISEMLAVFM